MARAVVASEGSVFLVPLKPSGFATGVVARTDQKGRAFGYFFGPRILQTARYDFNALVPARAVLVCRFGDNGLHSGHWPVVGKVQDFQRDIWALPNFRRKHDSHDQSYVSEYDDRLNCLSEVIVRGSAKDFNDMPYDAQLGSSIVEQRLGEFL
jgi:hypothetical protein